MAGKKRRRRHPGGAPSGMAADHPQASRQNGRPVQIKGQQEVPVRRGGKQVRYVQPGRGAAYPVNGAVYGRNGGLIHQMQQFMHNRKGCKKEKAPSFL